ncbi:MAG: tetratricopeptide repeat protein [Pirellulales bacterium]|nr:tetratricopeptide repeat protein [Pirellulales bacterium]
MDERQPKTACQRATKLFKSGFTQPALDVIELELRDRPDQGELWLLRATILHCEGRWPEALNAIETASTLMPLTVGGELVLADCYSHLGKHELALVSYEHLLSRQTLPVDYYAGLYAGFKRADKYELAMSACRMAIELLPENDEAYFGMAHCMSALAYPPRQITTVLRKAVELSPDKPQYRISLSLQLSLTKRRSQAYEVLSKREPEILESLSCNCMARQLLELCAWAGDQERCSRLGAVLARLGQSNEKIASEMEANND